MIDELKKIGLTDGEAKVYSALLKKGNTTVGPVVKESGVAYSNIYEILDRLMKKGLITYVVKEKTRHFQITSPENLNVYLEQKQKDIESQKETLNKILPQIKKVSLELLEEAEIYTGKKGLRSAYEIMLQTARRKEEFLFFYNLHGRDVQEINEFYLKILQRFSKAGVVMKGIGDESHRKVSEKHRTSWNKMRYVSFPIPASLDIFQDKILLISWKTQTGFLIKSEELAQNFREYFYSIWAKANN